MSGDVTLLVGTTKGLFILSDKGARAEWSVRGPLCDGWSINHAIGDPDSGTIWAAGGGGWNSAGVWRSEDGGENWSYAKLAAGDSDEWFQENRDVALEFGMPEPEPAPFTEQIESLWSLRLANGRLFAGAKPATLFVSDDDGESWDKVHSLTDHPSVGSWVPGGAGLTLHTIVSSPDAPEKLWLGISSAGVFASEDGGASWERRNRRSNRREASDDPGHPAAGDADEIGHCVHNMVRAQSNGAGGDLLYQQNHHGVFRSVDGGRSWQDVTDGLPSTFGFPIAVHPRDPQMIWVLPLNGDSVGRFPPDASAAVWKSTDGGQSWSDKRAGLPTKDCYFTVLRQAMATDNAAPAGVYFGTNSGSVFASANEGDTWDEIVRHLPTILCVEVLQRD